MSRDLEQARSDLRRLGYLSHSYDRYLLQDALRPRRPWRTLGRLTLKVAAAGGVLFSLLLAFALAAVNGNLLASPFDLIPLFFHLLPAAAAAIGAGFLVLSGLLVAVLRFYPVRRIEVLCFGVALTAGALVAAIASWRLLELWSNSERWTAVTFALALPLAIFALIRLIEIGLLTLAIRLTELTPSRRSVVRRWVVAAVLVGLTLILLPVMLSGRAQTPPPPSLPTAAGGRVLLVGVDGVLRSELEYLLSRGSLPGLASLLGQGGVLARYERSDGEPALFWTGLATGLDAGRHGVTAIDSFLPLGVETALTRNGPLRLYWRGVSVPLGLAEYRPVLAHRRHAFTVWELAARGGRPVAAVNWWSTFPAEPLPGLVVAHGAYQLLAEGAPEALAARPELATWAAAARESVTAGEMGEVVAAALPPRAAAEVLQRAVLPDRFYLRVLAQSLALEPRVAALYLPGPDLAADEWSGGAIAFADLVRAHLEDLDRLLLAHARDFDTVALVFDPGRRGGASGRVLLWRRDGSCAAGGSGDDAAPPTIAAEAVAAGLALALGLPQSAELPEPPGVCAWPVPDDRVATYGERRPVVARGEAESDEYLRSLRSLGYL